MLDHQKFMRPRGNIRPSKENPDFQTRGWVRDFSMVEYPSHIRDLLHPTEDAMIQFMLGETDDRNSLIH